MGHPHMRPDLLARVRWSGVLRLCRWAGIRLPRLRRTDSLQAHASRQLLAAVDGIEQHRKAGP
jgi:hypothetical protein